METIYKSTMDVELVQGISKKGTTYNAVRVGDSLIFDHRLVTNILMDYLDYLEKEAKKNK